MSRRRSVSQNVDGLPKDECWVEVLGPLFEDTACARGAVIRNEGKQLCESLLLIEEHPCVGCVAGLVLQKLATAIREAGGVLLLLDEFIFLDQQPVAIRVSGIDDLFAILTDSCREVTVLTREPFGDPCVGVGPVDCVLRSAPQLTNGGPQCGDLLAWPAGPYS